MSDPWREFSARAPGEEFAGYFEANAGLPGESGRATWYVGDPEIRTITARSSPEEEGRASARFLQNHRDRAVIGYLGFDAVGIFEPTLRRVPAGSPFPLGEFAYAEGVRRARVPRRTGSPRRSPLGTPRAPVSDSLPRPAYQQAVRRLVEEIRNGESYQVVLAHRRTWKRPAELVSAAGRLRRDERFAFFYYLKFGDREILGASPESVVEVAKERAYLNPIAGTIPRGRGRARRRPLTVDPKELSEHRMLVDLARNDLGAVARPGTVRLLSVEQVERYARLDHLVTHVGARLKPGIGPWDVLGSAFPAGTVSGAPKIRATELLRREERSWRGPYAGTVGLLDAPDRAQWALAIRTAFAARNRVYTAAGAGIVHRSEPAREFEETLTKLAQVEATIAGGAP
jgi:anthranilate/para-aminobenzoate synthase component I